MLKEYADINFDMVACRYLGDIYIRYSIRNYYYFREGIRYYEKAALNGDKESKVYVGINPIAEGDTGYSEIGKKFYYGIGTEINYEKAVEYFQRGIIYGLQKMTIDQSNCWFYKGLSYYEGNGNKQDYGEAFINFGVSTGWDIDKWPDLQSAMNDTEYKKSYHNTEAMRYLSRCYRFGRGCEKDLKLAEEWLQRAAMTDDALKDFYENLRKN